MAFVTPLTTPFRSSRTALRQTSPRCALGDSVAPKIHIVDTKYDGTSSVSINWDPVAPPMSEAVAVTANTALKISLAGLRTTYVDSGEPVGMATDNCAPVITFDGTTGISVSYDIIDPVVGGQTSATTTPFWKTPTYKWADMAAPVADEEGVPETLDTTLYEKYYPSNIRNLAPVISMKKPAGEWDHTAYINVSSEYIDLSVDIAYGLKIKLPMDSPTPAGSTATAKYFPEDRLHLAPEIVIKQDLSVEVGNKLVPEPSSLARIMFNN